MNYLGKNNSFSVTNFVLAIPGFRASESPQLFLGSSFQLVDQLFRR